MNIYDKILPKINNLPASGIRKYFDLLGEMSDSISLGIGEPDFVTPWSICETGVYSLEKGHTHYTSNAGLLELRRQIALYLEKRFDVSYDFEKQVIVTVGGSEAIDLALRCLVQEGDEVIIPEPSFVAYKGCVNIIGAKAVTVNLREEDDFRLTPAVLESVITSKSKVLIFPFPNNPTGAIMEKEDIEKLIPIIKKHGLIVISDEVYAELTYGRKHVSIASWPEMYDSTVLVGGFSKTFAMTGWRLGYVCAHTAITAAMNKIHQYAIMCSPTTAQYAGIEALKNGQKYCDEMVSEYNIRRKFMTEAFRSMGLSCFEALGAFYIFPSVRETGLTSEEFCDRLLQEEKVCVIPGPTFGESGEGFVRVAYCKTLNKLEEAAERISRFVNKCKNK